MKLLLIACWFLLSVCCKANVHANNHTLSQPLTMKMSLKSSQIVAGEPLILTLVAENTSSRTLIVNPDLKPSQWLNVTITDTSGYRLRSLVDNREVPYGDSGITPIRFLTSNSRINREIVLGQWWSFRRPGRYKISIKADVSVFSGTKDQTVGSLPLKVEYSLTVLPFSSRKLSEKVKTFLVHILKSEGDEENVAIQALFSISESVAGESWNNLIETTSAYTHPEIWNQLSRLGTPTAYRLMQTITQRKEQARLEHQAQLEREQQENWRQMMENASQQP